jgi:hypothetical protein
MSLCHESQIFEWLPWSSGEEAPTREEFAEKFRKRHSKINERYGLDDDNPREFFKLTGWGKKADKGEIEELLGLIQ